MPDRTIDHCIHEMATAYCSQEAMRMLFLNQSSESNKALDLPAMSGIFSGLSAGKINKKMNRQNQVGYLKTSRLCIVDFIP